jgi:hypothetical protein
MGMGKNFLFKGSEIISDHTEETGSNNEGITYNKRGLKRTFINLVFSNGEKISNWLQEIRHTKRPGLRLLFTVLMFSLVIIQEVILLSLLIVYFVIGAAAVILYMIFYEKICKKLLLKFKKVPNPSLCDYEWDYTNLNLDCEEL